MRATIATSLDLLSGVSFGQPLYQAVQSYVDWQLGNYVVWILFWIWSR